MVEAIAVDRGVGGAAVAREAYREELDALQGKTLDMADMVQERLDDALRVLRDHDPPLARSVIEGDEVINRRYLEIEDDCVDLLALQQPVAGDLRFVAATFKITTDLERIADLAVNLAEYAEAAEGLGDEPRPLDVAVAALVDLEPEVAGIVADAVAAYRTRDVAACRAVAERDDRLDAAIEEATQEIVYALVAACTADDTAGPVVESVSRFLLVLRDLERVGDHAVNIAARTLYMVEHDDALLY